jgi:TonB family protein
MRAASLLAALIMAAPVAQEPPLTPASLLLSTDSTHIDEKRLSAALAHPDPDVRAAAARVVGVFSVASIAESVSAALLKETDARAGAELARALLFLRGDAANDVVQAAGQRLGRPVTNALKVWQERAASMHVPAVPNDLMFSRTVDVWLPGLFSGLATAAQCGVDDEPRFGFVRLTYSRDGRPRRVEIDKGNLSKPCASVLAALGRTTLAEDDQPIGEGQQQWVVVPFSRAFAKCTEQIDAESAGQAPPSRGQTPKKTKDVRPQYPREMQSKRASGFVMADGWISTRGCLTKLRIVRSDGLPFELEALRAMSGWEFEPARSANVPVAVRTTLTTTFSIK